MIFPQAPSSGHNVLAFHMITMTSELTCSHMKHIHAPQRMNLIIAVFSHHIQDQLLTHTLSWSNLNKCHEDTLSMLMILRGWTPLLLYWPQFYWLCCLFIWLCEPQRWQLRSSGFHCRCLVIRLKHIFESELKKKKNFLHLCSTRHWVVFNSDQIQTR